MTTEDIDYLIIEIRSLEDKFEKFVILNDKNWEDAEKRIAKLEKRKKKGASGST